MNTLGFTKLQQYVDYLDGCYSHVTNLEHFREQLLADCDGAKNEPNGVLYGQVADKAKSNESMTLLYLEYGDESTFGWLIEYEQQLREAGYDEETIAHLVLEAVK